jgi:hypothetical protein
MGIATLNPSYGLDSGFTKQPVGQITPMKQCEGKLPMTMADASSVSTHYNGAGGSANDLRKFF